MEFHGVDVPTQFKRMRELVVASERAEWRLPQVALGIAHITQCAWCIQAHTKKAVNAGASDAEIAETTFVAMAMAAGAAWSHGGLALQCLQEHRGT